MLLDATALLVGIVLAAAGFFVVVLVCVLVLRLLGVVLGDDVGDEAGRAETAVPDEPDSEAPAQSESTRGDADERTRTGDVP